jgi:Holliday junction resolvase RusA-like endonuclease
VISFTVPGEPQGKARARTGKGFSYTPEKTVIYENLIKISYSQVCKTIFEPGKPLEMVVRAYYSIPKSYTKGKRLAAKHNIIRPTKKPDADNVLKVVADALNKTAYDDDTQIVRAVVEKYFGEVARVEVELREVS